MVVWDMKGTYDNAKPKIDGVVSAVGQAADRHPGFYVAEAGSVSSGKALDKMFADQLKLAGERSIPITVIVLLLVFGALVAVGVPLLGPLTVLPALLSRLGDKVEKGKIPFLHRLRRDSGENRFWKAILTPVLRRPVVAATLAGGVLLVLAAPVLQLHTSQSGLDAMPNSAPTVGTMKKIEKAFSNGDLSPAIVAIEANTDSAATKQAI